MREQVKEFFNHIFAGATWDAAKYFLGPLVVALATAVWEKIKHGSLDWYAIGGLFAVTMVVTAVAFPKKDMQPHPIRAQDTVKPVPKLRIHGAVYGAGPGRDIDVTEKLKNAVRDALVIPVDNNLVPQDPAIGIRKRLAVEYSYGDGVVCSVARPESMQGDIVRLVLPEDSELPKSQNWRKLYLEENQQRTHFQQEHAKAANEVSELKKQLKPLPTYPIPELRLKVLSLCSELQGFLGTHGEEPTVNRGFSETANDFQRRWRSIVQPWRAKFVGDYNLKFKDLVPRLRDEIRVRAGIDDSFLNGAIDRAANDPNANVTAVKEVIKGLWDIALNIHS